MRAMVSQSALGRAIGERMRGTAGVGARPTQARGVVCAVYAPIVIACCRAQECPCTRLARHLRDSYRRAAREGAHDEDMVTGVQLRARPRVRSA